MSSSERERLQKRFRYLLGTRVSEHIDACSLTLIAWNRCPDVWMRMWKAH